MISINFSLFWILGSRHSKSSGQPTGKFEISQFWCSNYTIPNTKLTKWSFHLLFILWILSCKCFSESFINLALSVWSCLNERKHFFITLFYILYNSCHFLISYSMYRTIFYYHVVKWYYRVVPIDLYLNPMIFFLNSMLCAVFLLLLIYFYIE